MEQSRTIRALRLELAQVQAKLDALAMHRAQSTANSSPIADTDIAGRIALLRHVEKRTRPVKRRLAIADHAGESVSYPALSRITELRIAVLASTRE